MRRQWSRISVRRMLLASEMRRRYVKATRILPYSLLEASVEVVLVGEKGVRDQRSQSVRRDGRREGWGRRRAITEAEAFKLQQQLCVLLH